MKRVFLFLMGLSLLAVSCKDDEKNPTVEPVTPNPDYSAVTFEKMVKDFKFIEGVAVADVNTKATADMNAWVTELNGITKNLINAKEGQFGFLPDGKKKRFINAKGVETEQLIKKGLIGALQLNKFNEASMDAIIKAKSADERKKALATAVKYILGNATVETSKGDYSSVGNSFGKYMMSTAGSTKYKDIHKDIFGAIKKANENAENPAEFNKAMVELNNKVTTVVAFRAVHYMAGYAEKIRKEFTGNATHELSEGLGFAYSLQFAYKADTHGFYLTPAEAKAIADVDLWKEAKDNSGNSLLDRESKRIAKMFGFTVADAK
ncbi:MAG: DUF4856 domain-containing protein [Flavobacteriaceae bacterium]|nr:DUF4856 domain-containing protein [Flavobacteriaceae bacterium]